MPRTNSRRKAFEAAQLSLDLSGTCDLWLADLAPAAPVRPACSVTAPAGPAVGASPVNHVARLLFTRPCGMWRRPLLRDGFAAFCIAPSRSSQCRERRA